MNKEKIIEIAYDSGIPEDKLLEASGKIIALHSAEIVERLLDVARTMELYSPVRKDLMSVVLDLKHPRS
jgi:hypothetical protein